MDMTPEGIGNEIRKEVKAAIAAATAFATKKYGDTPTDALQLVPKKYVTSVVAGMPSATPGGPNGAIQFNNGSVFGGSSGLVWDTTIPTFPFLEVTGGLSESIPSSTAVWTLFGGTLFTTDATPGTITAITTAAGVTTTVELYVNAYRTGGTSGSAGDSAGYIRRATYKNVAGTLSLVGSIQDGFTSEDQAAWDVTFAISGQLLQIQVTGAANNNITWDYFFKYYI